jgi:uncharacterized protein (DUF2252 family)
MTTFGLVKHDATADSGESIGKEHSVLETSTTDFAERRARGRAARKVVPRSSQGEWSPADDRPDPVALLEEQGADRVPELLPVRYGRMLVSPFTFYRGAALIMAADLAKTPNSGITVQLCGDAHLSNFGVFGTPERKMIFDINDFDETLPGPWEWDLKRLAASFEVAGRHRAFSKADRREITLRVVRGYRERMKKSAEARVLEAWYDRLDVDQVRELVRNEQKAHRAEKKQVERVESIIAKAFTKDSMNVFEKLVGHVDGELRILADPPLIVPVEDLVEDGIAREEDELSMRELLSEYQTTLLQTHHPIKEFDYVHMARKVVGVGSVGTRAWIVLLTGRDDRDPLLLQAKEAQPSVLERFLKPSEFGEHGKRVVMGQRMMQAASDIFLGWQRVIGIDGRIRDYYIRQLHDWKGSFDPEISLVPGALIYAGVCGETLARAHARSGDRVAIASYLGESESFDEAIADFSEAYADQNERDFQAFAGAVASGRLVAATGL